MTNGEVPKYYENNKDFQVPPKGQSNNPNGRTKGVPNKATTNAREAIAAFVEGNVDRLNGWLDAIAAESPKQAFDCFMGVVEYNIPKLARTEVQPLGKDGKPADNITKIIIEHVAPKK